MKKYTAVVIFVLILVTSCVTTGTTVPTATTATQNLNVVTSVAADKSFGFDTAVRDFSDAVREFRFAVNRLESANQTLVDLLNYENEPELIALSRANSMIFAARISTIRTRDEVLNMNNIITQYLEDFVLADTNFRRAEQAVIISSEPQASIIRHRAVQAHNISLRTFNNAMERLGSQMSLLRAIFDEYDEAVAVFYEVVDQLVDQVGERFPMN